MALKSLEEKHPIDHHILQSLIYENDNDDDDDDNEWGENDCDGDDNWAGVARTEVSSTGESRKNREARLGLILIVK